MCFFVLFFFFFSWGLWEEEGEEEEEEEGVGPEVEVEVEVEVEETGGAASVPFSTSLASLCIFFFCFTPQNDVVLGRCHITATSVFGVKFGDPILGLYRDRLTSLPEGCVAAILSLTCPRDVCRSSTISSGFIVAADSDTIWEKFLPSDYGEIISRSASPVVFHSKKQLYFSLCESPILIDRGQLSFAVHKQSGKKCYMLPARELGIIWGETPQYWSWISLPQSRFLEVAHLVKVCWFDIMGRVNTQILSPKTIYAAYFVFEIAEENDGLEYAPMQASVRFAGEVGDETIYLNLLATGEEDNAPLGPVPRRRKDGWMEIELGEFFNDGGNNHEVEMGLREIEHLNWKSGLIVEGIELRPKVDA